MEIRRMRTRSQPMSPSGFVSLETVAPSRRKRIQRASPQNTEDAEGSASDPPLSGTAAESSAGSTLAAAPKRKSQRKTQRKTTTRKNQTTSSVKNPAERASDSENVMTTDSAKSMSPDLASFETIHPAVSEVGVGGSGQSNGSASHQQKKPSELTKKMNSRESTSRMNDGKLLIFFSYSSTGSCPNS